MDKQSERHRFGHLRSRATKKPSVTCPPIRFYRCPVCGAVLTTLQAAPAQPPVCCGAPMEELLPRPAAELEPEVKLNYLIFGSLNENAVKAEWVCEDFREAPVWVYLRTFTGGQIKYLTPKKRSPILFGLADEDAYAYCDKDPCVECTFRCKRGLALYYYFEGRGLIHLPLERMEAPRPDEKLPPMPLERLAL